MVTTINPTTSGTFPYALAIRASYPAPGPMPRWAYQQLADDLITDNVGTPETVAKILGSLRRDKLMRLAKTYAEVLREWSYPMTAAEALAHLEAVIRREANADLLAIVIAPAVFVRNGKTLHIQQLGDSKYPCCGSRLKSAELCDYDAINVIDLRLACSRCLGIAEKEGLVRCGF